MVKGDSTSFGEEAKRQITGTKAPSKKRLGYTLFILLILWVASLFGAYYFGKGMDKLNEKSDVDIYLNPYIENAGEKQKPQSSRCN